MQIVRLNQSKMQEIRYRSALFCFPKKKKRNETRFVEEKSSEETTCSCILWILCVFVKKRKKVGRIDRCRVAWVECVYRGGVSISCSFVLFIRLFICENKKRTNKSAKHANRRTCKRHRIEERGGGKEEESWRGGCVEEADDRIEKRSTYEDFARPQQGGAADLG